MRTVICLLILLGFPFHALGEESSEGPVRVGVLLCLSGNCADWGNAALKGARLAVNEINNQGGVLGRLLELKVEDTRESISGAQAVSAYKKLVEVDSIQFLIGPSWSPGALALAPLVASRQDLLMITPSASAESFNKSGPQLFNMRPAERLATESLARFAYRKGWRKAAIFTSQQPAESTQGKIFAAEFLKRGGKIVKHIETNPELPEVRAEALRVVKSKPDVVLLMAYNQMNAAAKSLRELGYQGPVLTISIDESRVEAANGALEGVYVAKALPPHEEFSKKFRAAYDNEPPGLSAENGYDSIYALVRGIEKAHSVKVRSVVKSLPQVEFSGATGDVTFDKTGAVNQDPALFIVRNGSLRAVNWNAG